MTEQRPGSQDAVPQPTGDPTAENQRITVVGRIGAVPELRLFPDREDSNKTRHVANLRLAEHPDPKNSSVTVWHDVVFWDYRAVRLQQLFDKGHLKVGQELQVQGTIKHRERPTKDGSGTEIVEQIYVDGIAPIQAPTPEPPAPRRDAPTHPGE